jgi:hypothetical protein
MVKFEKVCAKEFFKLLKVSTLKFEKMCVRKFLEMLKLLTVKFEKVCAKEFFELLKVSTLKFEVCGNEVFKFKINIWHFCKFQVKFQVCARKYFKCSRVFLLRVCFVTYSD